MAKSESTKIEFGYFHDYESEQFAFYRIPKVLFTDEYFRNLSSDAKVLYGLMLDRMALSIRHHIRISFVVPPCKYINTQPILLLYLCCSVTLICINAFSISIIHAGYNMHILLLPVHHRKDKNLLPAPALDLTVFCIFPSLYLM